MTKTVSTLVTDKLLTIEFIHIEGKDNPKISAIEVHSRDSTTSANSTNSTEPPDPISFETVRFNAGATKDYTDKKNVLWRKDAYVNGGTTTTWDGVTTIAKTNDPEIYLTERWGDTGFKYDIPVPDGLFKVSLHFAELYASVVTGPGDRVFQVAIEESLAFNEIDIYAQAGVLYAALVREYPARVSSGALTIEFIPGGVQNPKLSGIEIEALGEVTAHQAHAVPGGPYIVTDTKDAKSVVVDVNGLFSHTHGPGATLVRWSWQENGIEVGSGETARIPFSVGVHTLTLEVTDSDGDTQSDVTTVTVRPLVYPDVTSVTPDKGALTGGDTITIIGTGFTYSAGETTVLIGSSSVTGSGLTIVNESAIIVTNTPKGTIGGDVGLSVKTPLGRSNQVSFTYVDGEDIGFNPGDVFAVGAGPTNLAFGPDGRLYIGIQQGQIIRLALNETYGVTNLLISSVVQESDPTFRSVLGIAFDPTDTSDNPSV